MDAKHARNSTDHQSLMRPPHHNWPLGYVAHCSARLVLTNALGVIDGLTPGWSAIRKLSVEQEAYGRHICTNRTLESAAISVNRKMEAYSIREHYAY